jgi:hypothetical protein
VNTPDPPDIPSVIEQLDSAVEHVPDWLWQGVASNLISEGLIATPFLVWLAWKHREKILHTLTKQPVVKRSAAHIRGTSSLTARTIKITVNGGIGTMDSFTSTVGKSLGLRWNIEAPTASLTERLAEEGLELLSWYVRQR